MAKQQADPTRAKTGVRIAALVTVIAIIAFGAAFYILDGVAIVCDVLGIENGAIAGDGPDASDSSTGTPEPDAQVLNLPEGMPEEFALRIWQEQIESQTNISRLANGEVEGFVIGKVTREGDTATLDIRVSFADETSAAGKMGMRRFGGQWYVAYVSGMRRGETGGMADDVGEGSGSAPETPLPDLEEVDIGVLNTILDQQFRSAGPLEEYATGAINSVTVVNVTEGPGTFTLQLEMDEDHEIGNGEIVILEKEIDGKPHFFIARFTKQGGTPK